MSEPKFSIGDRVAVCVRMTELVIPETIVVEVLHLRNEPYIDAHTNEFGYWNGWVYKTADGNGVWTRECWLRPILPGEYDETPTTTDQRISA